jgi:hypothetical protein
MYWLKRFFFLRTYVTYILLSFFSLFYRAIIAAAFVSIWKGGVDERERRWMIVTYHNTHTDDREREKKGRGGSCYWRDRKGTRHVTTRFGDDWAQHRHDDDLVVLFDSSPPSDQQHSWKSTYTRRSLWDWKILNPGAGCQSNVEFQHFFTWCYTHYNDNWQRVKSSAFIIRTYYILQPPKSCVSLTVRLETHRLDIANPSGD